MNEISKISQIITSGDLTATERTAVIASKGTKVKDLKIGEIEKGLNEILGKAYGIKGLSPRTQEYKITLSITTERVKNDFSYLTIEEIQCAIESGIYGYVKTTNELNVLSAENFIKWILAWREQIRKEAIHKQTHFEEKQRIESEKAKHEQKLSEFERFIENGILNGFEDNIGVKASVYRHLDNKAVIRLDLPTKKALYKAAQEKFTEMSYHDTLGILLVKDIAESMALDYYLAFGNE